jgi:6-phosphogluconolactonase
LVVVYIGNTESSEIFVFGLDAQSGALTLIEKSPIPGVIKPGSSTPIAVSPDKKFLYAGLRGDPIAAATFAIDAKSGRLKHLSTAALPATMAYLTTDRTGRFLLGASFDSSVATVNRIEDGAVQANPVQTLATPPNAHAIVFDRSNRYVFVPTRGGDVVLQLKFDAATGKMSANVPPTAASKKGAGPRHIVFHPNDKFAYLMNELDATVVVYAFDGAMGVLREVQTVSALPAGFADTPWAADIHLTPDGKFLYASERRTNTLAGYRVDMDTGQLTPIGNFPTETTPRGFAITPNSRYVLCVGQESHSLTVHAIDGGTGKLTDVKKYPVGKNPNWVEIVELP